MNKNKAYLGDSVYATFDGHSIVLTTENGDISDPSNEIVMEPAVLTALHVFEKQIQDAAMLASAQLDTDPLDTTPL